MTITEAMIEWKARKAVKESTIHREPLPQDAAEQLTELGTEIWGMALDLANSRLAQNVKPSKRFAWNWRLEKKKRQRWPTRLPPNWKSCR
jgi:hypothetical protein